MKHLYFIVVSFFIVGLAVSQEWMQNLPQDKLQNGNLSFYEIQEAFNDYWEPYNVVNGYYDLNGEKVKAPYWKQFRRWEWYWENRIDPATGEFPKTSGWEELQKHLKENPEQKSSSGNWTTMGPSTTSGGYAGLGRINCVAFVTGDNNTIYVGAASGGIWKTINGGSTWTPLGDGNPVLGVSDIAAYRPVTGPDILYIATGDRDGGSMWSLGGGQYNDNNSVGILKSIDGGSTWNTTGLSWTASQQRTVNRLIMDPTNINTLYAATSVGLYKTTNAGSSWTSLTGTNYVDLVFKPGTASTLYASNWSGDIYRSTNSGASFSSVYTTGNDRVELAVTANNSNVVYALMENGGGLGGVYKSTNGGSSFSQIYTGSLNFLGWNCNGGDSGGQGSYDLCIAADPNNANNVVVGGVNTWRSSDGGVNWTAASHWSGCSGKTTVHADQHYLAYQNGTSTLWLGNDGGLYKTTNNGVSWSHHGSGLVISQIYRMGTAQTTSNDVIIGLQDNGTKAMLSGSWSDELGGDGFECAVDYTNQNTMYGELYYGDLKRTTNHGASWTSVSSGITGSAHWCTPFVLDANVNTTLYIGYQDVWRSTNQGSNWTKISSWGGSTIRSLAVTAASSNTICAATQSTLYRTINGGSNWSNITGSLPTGSANITYVWIKDTDVNTIWVAMGGYNSFGVYQTTNGGANWTNISAGLPAIPVMSVIQNKQNGAQNEIYAGTDVGVYVKVGTANWVPFNTGLPNVVVAELDIYYNATAANSRLRAATYGRGLWESDLYSTGAAPVADFSASDVTPLVGQTVTFSDLSSNIPTTWTWSFSPPTVTYVGGTNANSQHPQVQFNTNGIYTVSLTAGNGTGSDNETKVNYIYAGTPGLWTGFSTTDWNTASNWHNFIVPVSTQDVTIPAAPFSWPTYIGNFALGTQCRDLIMDGASELNVYGDMTISAGRTLTCNANSNIVVAGNWSNQGTFNAGTSIVDFVGSTNSTISGPPGTTVYLVNDNFSSWPGNWNGDTGSGNGFWNQNGSANAGGSSPEAMFTWESATTTKRLYHNPVNTAGLLSLTLDFRHYVNDYSGSAYTVKVEYSTDGSTWQDAGWSVSPTGNISATPVSLTLTTAQGVGASNYYIAFTITGNLYNINYWYVDDVQLYYNSVGVQTFNSIIDSKSNSELIVNGNIVINNHLIIRPQARCTNTAGMTISIGGNAVMQANSSGMASYLDNGTTTITGGAIVEQYLSSEKWHLVSPPVSGATINTYYDIYLKEYNEPSDTWTYLETPTTMPMNVTQGYSAWASDAYTGSTNVSYTGNLSNTDHAINSLSFTSAAAKAGFNLIGNPYPCALDWNSNWSISNLSGWSVIYDNGTFKGWHPTSGSYNGKADGIIPSTQGFWVRALNASASLTIPASERLHSGQTFYKETFESIYPEIRLEMEINGYTDEGVVIFHPETTEGFDGYFDLYKFENVEEAPHLYTITSGGNYGVNFYGPDYQEKIIPVGFRTEDEGIYTINASSIINFDNDIGIYLEDLKNETFTNLTDNPQYEFSYNPFDEAHRFNLHFTDQSLNVEETKHGNLRVYSLNEYVIIRNPDLVTGDIVVYNMMGQMVSTTQLNGEPEFRMAINQGRGYYLVKFHNELFVLSERVLIK